MKTAERLVAAAAELLDAGGEAAVTLRAVGSAIGVSHNAPYKHFDSRDDLLAAVAAADFAYLADAWTRIRRSRRVPLNGLLSTFDVVIRFNQEHPARYRLLFGTPSIAARGGELSVAAEKALEAFAAIVEDCQVAGDLPSAPGKNLAVILFATAHGLIEADATGRIRARTGWTSMRSGLQLLTGLLNPGKPDSAT